MDLAPLRRRALSALEPLRPLALLLGRLAVGVVFANTGWGKIHNVEKVTQFFTELGIPMPHLNAIFVGWTELLCGLALCLGVLTRLQTVPLAVSMVVAILTAKLKDIHGVTDLFAADEFTYILVLVMIAILGPGPWSVDHILAKRFAGADEA